CCWGKQAILPWAVTFNKPESHDLVGVPLGVPLHPTQLYEALAEAVIFLILYRRFSRPHQPGAIIGLYLVLYSTVRFFDDFLLDFQQLAALYAKQYAPYEWKRDALKIDLLQLSPWLDKVRNTKNDIEFYEICAAYVASLNDAHSEFFLPTDFQADLLFDVDQY